MTRKGVEIVKSMTITLLKIVKRLKRNCIKLVSIKNPVVLKAVI